MDPRTRLIVRAGGEFVPDVIARASGSWLTTTDGRRVLDFTSGQICATIGHSHPDIIEAARRAFDEVAHLNSWMLSEPVLALADRLTRLLPEPLERMMFLSTGGEVNEAALRMAKLVTGGFEVAAPTRSWHGMTAGSQALTFAAGRRGHGPAQPGIFALPAPYAYRCPIRHCTGSCDSTCLQAGFELFDQQSVGAPAAVLIEPVLSAGGVIVPPADYFVRLQLLCRERGMMLILDEAQTGFGRLGAMFGFEIFDVVPDLLTMSKTLGGGIPVSALATTAEIEQTAYDRGLLYLTSHAYDPLPAAVAMAVIDVVERDQLAEQARNRGERLRGHLDELQRRHESIGDVRGIGLLWGVELVDDRDTKQPADQLGDAVTDECQRCGLCINIVRGKGSGASACLRIAPPLTVSDDEIDQAAQILDDALTASTR